MCNHDWRLGDSDNHEVITKKINSDRGEYYIPISIFDDGNKKKIRLPRTGHNYF